MSCHSEPTFFSFAADALDGGATSLVARRSQ